MYISVFYEGKHLKHVHYASQKVQRPEEKLVK